MKNLITILFTGLLTLSLSAQQFGAKAGLDLTDLTITDSDMPDFDMGIGYSVGIFGEFELSDVVKLKSELLYAHRSSVYEVDLSLLGGGIATLEITSEFIELPISFSYSANDELSINAGPFIGFQLSSKTKSEMDGEKEEEDFTDQITSMDYGFNCGVSYTINENTIIDLRYVLGLPNIAVTEGGDETTVKSSAIKISFGYIFGN